MKKDYIKTVLVLTIICLVVAVLLAVTNYITAPIIAEGRAAKIQESLQAVIPGGSFEEVALPEGTAKTVTSLYKETSGKGYVAVLTTTSQYSSGDMGITAAIDETGTITAVTLTSYQESKDFGKATYPQNYVGTNADTVGSVDTFAGVTYSSTALRNALTDALAAYHLVEEAAK